MNKRQRKKNLRKQFLNRAQLRRRARTHGSPLLSGGIGVCNGFRFVEDNATPRTWAELSVEVGKLWFEPCELTLRCRKIFRGEDS